MAKKIKKDEEQSENVGLNPLRNETIHRWEGNRLLDDLSGNVDPGAAALFESDLSYSTSEETDVNEEESELETLRETFAQLHVAFERQKKEMKGLQDAVSQLEAEKSYLNSQLEEAKRLGGNEELDIIKGHLTRLYSEFVAANRRGHDQISLVNIRGVDGLINKLRKAFPFLK